MSALSAGSRLLLLRLSSLIPLGSMVSNCCGISPLIFFSFPFYLRSFPKFAGSENWHSPHIYIFIFFWLMPKVGIVLLALVQPAHVLLGIRDVGAMFCR